MTCKDLISETQPRTKAPRETIFTTSSTPPWCDSDLFLVQHKTMPIATLNLMCLPIIIEYRNRYT